MQIILLAEIGLFLLVWATSSYKILPNPVEVFNAFRHLWMVEGLGQELITSLWFNVQAILLTTVISLIFSYLSVMPVFRPIVQALSKGRFLSLVGFSLVFTVMLGGGHAVKLAMLVFGMSVFFITSMASVVLDIPRSDFDFARTLHMGEWKVVWEVVVLGTADRAFEVMRQNAAIGWMMLTMVEGIVRSEGGVGVLLLNVNKYLNLPEVFAIQIAILIVGLLQDSIIGLVRRTICPYAYITTEQSK